MCFLSIDDKLFRKNASALRNKTVKHLKLNKDMCGSKLCGKKKTTGCCRMKTVTYKS